MDSSSPPGHLATQCLMVVGQKQPQVSAASASLCGAVGKVLQVPNVAMALKILKEAAPDLVLLTEEVGLAEGLQLFQKIASSCPHVSLLIPSSAGDSHTLTLLRQELCRQLPLPLDVEQLDRLLCMQGCPEAQDSPARGGRLVSRECPPHVQIVGRSRGLVRSLELIRTVARSKCNPVLILGETGTGKELAARAVHSWRHSSMERFVAVNCAALTANLLESELFGHVKGAFTGADREKAGLFEMAQDGSIFLDEISEMPLELQAKLLRVLQERTFRKVGGTKDIHANATVIASSNRKLMAEVEAGRFRRDLYYRLAVFPITLPSLREESRRGDIPLLAEYFIESSSIPPISGPLALSEEARRRLVAYSWPGNVRELRNVIERAIILETSCEIRAASLIFDTQEELPPQTPASCEQIEPPASMDFSLEAAEREFIIRALKETGWQRTRAAALLGITRATLHSKLKRYDIKSPDGQSSTHTMPPEDTGSGQRAYA